ncbi:NlpC/P60 family protein, partial [Mycobacterium sp.]|uniref:NlpC/P60 family protein n=1 Tax=Mycobacterium sp. TaxID=1785 RepID=UPI0031DCCA06
PGTTGPGTAGPGLGADPSANAVGFDASGLVQYAYAGAGLKMPRTSGQQCNVGRKVLPAQAQPGDLICFGPAGSEGVAIYIGNGQMVEATPPAVMVTTARSDGMNPYLTRIIG